jgi:hypothetical protein
MKQKAKNDFDAILDNMKMSDGKLSYNRSFKYEDTGITVWITSEAYRKILTKLIATTMVKTLTYSVGRQNGCDGPHLDADDDKKIQLVKQKP